MKKFILSFLILFISVLPVYAGLIYQDFEEDNESSTYGWSVWNSIVGFSGLDEPVYSGERSWKMTDNDPYGEKGDYGTIGIRGFKHGILIST